MFERAEKKGLLRMGAIILESGRVVMSLYSSCTLSTDMAQVSGCLTMHKARHVQLSPRPFSNTS